MDSESFPRAEEALKLLANAVVAARLYPAASTLPREAVDKFTERANELASAMGPLRYAVDPHAFRVGDSDVGGGTSPVVAFAEALHAMQVGQLVIAPGITAAETTAFVAIANSEVASVRAAGGVRAALVGAGVTHLAVIEVSLRATEEGGLAGLDLASAPIEEIATEVAAAAERRAAAARDGAAPDEMASAIGTLEEATREIAMERVATALLRLDEETRAKVMSAALAADAEGTRMEGMLAVIARMKPASLARLMKLVAAQAGTEPSRLASVMQLPPETAKMLSMLLAPVPSVEPDFGVEPREQARQLAATVAEEADTTDLERQVAVAGPALTSSRALGTAVAVSRRRLDEESIRAIGEVLPQSARDGAFTGVREALRRLDEIANDPGLADEVARARATLADPSVLADVCRAPQTDADAAIAGEILHAAGTAGADALLEAYIRSPEQRRSLLRPVLRGMSEGVLGVARQRLRSAEPRTAIAILATLPALGDRRAVPVITESISSLDEQVRFAAINALGAMPVAEANAALIKALGHREPETQRYVVRVIGQSRIPTAVPALSRALEDVNILQRTYETRKEIIQALARIGTPEAEKALRNAAARTLGIGKRAKELRATALGAAKQLAANRGVDRP